VRFDRSLLTNASLQIFGLTLLGFLGEYLLRPVVPLVILERGGDAALIGLITGLFALPSIGLRPLVGWLVDRWSQRRVLGFGTGLATVAPAGLLLPGMVALAVTRFVQGSAWALFTVATRTLMAQAAPANRRAEASAYFAAMPALAVLVAPGAGVALYLATGSIGPVLVAIAIAATTLVIALRLPSELTPKAVRRSDGESESMLRSFVEPAVIPATVMTAMFSAADTLFTIFPPIFVGLVGAEIDSLAIYYPAYGLASALSLFVVGRVSNRLDRGTGIRIGAAFAVVGLTVAILAGGLFAFWLGGATYAVGASFATAALGALSIDRAPPRRLGSAMATYSIGFQVAIGASAVIWGPLIVAVSFDAALASALLLVVAVAFASLRFAGPPATAAPSTH
jgi:MFS family permease